MNFPSQMPGRDSLAIFYNSSTNQRPSIGGNISCRPIGIENFLNINKRWRYCTEKEEKWVKETKYSAVQLLTNNAFWREKNGGKKKKKMREQFQFFERGLVYVWLRASERVRFQSNFDIDQASAIFLAVCWFLTSLPVVFLNIFEFLFQNVSLEMFTVYGTRYFFPWELIFLDIENFSSLRYLIFFSRYFPWCWRCLMIAVRRRRRGRCRCR